MYSIYALSLFLSSRTCQLRQSINKIVIFHFSFLHKIYLNRFEDNAGKIFRHHAKFSEFHNNLYCTFDCQDIYRSYASVLDMYSRIIRNVKHLRPYDGYKRHRNSRNVIAKWRDGKDRKERGFKDTSRFYTVVAWNEMRYGVSVNNEKRNARESNSRRQSTDSPRYLIF